MKWFESLKEEINRKREKSIRRLAEETVTLSDYAGRIYIAYNGVPLIVVNDDWSPKDILNKLTEIRVLYTTIKKDN